MSEFPGDAFAVAVYIEEEKGRFVLYLEVHFWEPETEDKVGTYRHRIQDYPTRRQAEVAAKWIKSAAERDIQDPPSGF